LAAQAAQSMPVTVQSWRSVALPVIIIPFRHQRGA
jgi:hypothetical protein